MTVHIKVCGVTNVDDALGCVALGVSAIGLNFVPGTPRVVDLDTARAIAAAVSGRALLVGVVANATRETMERIRTVVGCLQLHGDEPPEALEPFLPHAYKAIRVADAADIALAERYPGEHVLVDARVEGALGGTGVRVDPALVAPLARKRRVTLAGGLRPSNVAEALQAVHPYAVDVASGVERAGDPRRKDLAAVEAFVAAVRAHGF